MFSLDNLIGKTYYEAINLLKNNNLDYRVCEVNGLSFVVMDDMNLRRVNLALKIAINIEDKDRYKTQRRYHIWLSTIGNQKKSIVTKILGNF
jgi:hypothetical protein